MKHCLLFIHIIDARKQNMKKLANLANRVAIITGGAMDNGLGTAQVLAKQSPTVILLITMKMLPSPPTSSYSGG